MINNENLDLTNIKFEDRNSLNPNRRKLKIISQTADTIIADVEYADAVQNSKEGTPLNANILNNLTQSVIKSENDSTTAVDIANDAKETANDAVERIAKVQGTKVKVNGEFVTDFNADDYLKQTGGTMTGTINIAQGSDTGINIGENGHIITDGKSVFNKNLNDVNIGHNSLSLKLKGNNTRPKYTSDGSNYKDIALSNDLEPYQLKLKHIKIDAINLNQDTYYPVIIPLVAMADCINRIEIHNALRGTGNPSWATHESGFSVNFAEEVLGDGWGTQDQARTILQANYRFASEPPIGDVGQMSHQSIEYIYVRGGASYDFYVPAYVNGVQLITSTYTNGEQSISTKTSVTFPKLRFPQEVEVTSINLIG